MTSNRSLPPEVVEKFQPLVDEALAAILVDFEYVIALAKDGSKFKERRAAKAARRNQ